MMHLTPTRRGRRPSRRAAIVANARLSAILTSARGRPAVGVDSAATQQKAEAVLDEDLYC